MKKQKFSFINKYTRENWGIMSFYEKFEQIIAHVLSILIAITILISIYQLISQVFPLIITGTVNILDHKVFQSIFGMVMTVLIAMEFKHSIVQVIEKRKSIIQVKTVILIAMLAISRKFIILDIKVTNAETIASLAFTILVLGVVYWLMRERDDKE